jgi:hypothetical protein
MVTPEDSILIKIIKYKTPLDHITVFTLNFLPYKPTGPVS